MSLNKSTISGTYYVNTYGCQMNVHESEKICGIFSALGLIAAQSIEDADYIVYNTCCVRETAETKVFGHLGKAKKIKEQRPSVKIILCGCMGQRPGGAAILRKKFPFINLIIGTHNIHMLSEYLSRIEREKITEIMQQDMSIALSTDKPNDLAGAVLRSDPLSAFVNIMQGCDNFCSYCIVPYVRGREISRPKNDILNEINSLVNNGYKEITLLGQNVNSYGKKVGNFGQKRDEFLDGVAFDTESKIDFASLMSDINKLKGEFWVKFMTSHPKDFTLDIVRVLADGDKLKKHVHLPVQAGSDMILHKMNRGYTRAQYLNKLEMIRKHMPDAGITSDVMVGFPGETEQDFLDTLQLVREARFNNLFTFIYNKRDGTPAATMENQVPREVKVERLSRLIKLQDEIARSQANECIGKTYEVLCDSVTAGKGTGKTENEQPISFAAQENMKGTFLRVTATSSKNSNLFGVVSK